MLGVTLGLGLLTKATFYYTAVPIAFIALILYARRHTLRLTQVVLVFAPALVIGSIWWLRNLIVYGGLDVMGLARHNAVVVGQPATAQWLSDYGASGLLQRFFTTTYRSFWGQFGWMSTPLPEREYLLLGGLCIVALIGWIGWFIQGMRDEGGRQSPKLIPIPTSDYLVALVSDRRRLCVLQPDLRAASGTLFVSGVDSDRVGVCDRVVASLDQIKSLVARRLSRAARDWTPWLDQAQLISYALIYIYLARLDLVALQRYIIPTLSP